MSRSASSIPRALVERYGNVAPFCVSDTPFVDGKVTPEAYAAALEQAAAATRVVSLYVHLPFCPARCLYCGCNTTVTHAEERIDHYLEALDREMALVAGRLGGRRRLSQMHWGGGTPNYLSDTQLVQMMAIVERHFEVADDTELSIEANPKRASATQLDLLAGLGFRRISFGVQDLDPEVQRAIGRYHSFDMIADVFATARDSGFRTVAMDLMYGLPGQSAASFERTLEQVARIDPDRIACFGYAHNPAIRPHQRAIDAARLPTAIESLGLFDQAVRALTEAGYAWIGLECFTRAADELAVAHGERRLGRNWIGYTARHSHEACLGFGAGAISEVSGTCVQSLSDPDAWAASVARGRLPVARGMCLSGDQQARREAMTHLLCNQELPRRVSAPDLHPDHDRWARYAADGLVARSSEGISVTPHGRYFLRQLCMEHAPAPGWESVQWQFPRMI
jgi:oxygen-independent coproporphyrinogen-3 oxidase